MKKVEKRGKWLVGSIAIVVLLSVGACSHDNTSGVSKPHLTKAQFEAKEAKKEKDEQAAWYKEDDKLGKQFGSEHEYLTNYLFKNQINDKWKETANEYFGKMRQTVDQIVANKPINKKTKADYDLEKKAYTDYINATYKAEKQIKSGDTDGANGTLTDANTKLQNELYSN